MLPPKKRLSFHHPIPWEPITFIFRGYNPYIGGSKPSFFMVLGSKGIGFTWNDLKVQVHPTNSDDSVGDFVSHLPGTTSETKVSESLGGPETNSE